MLPEIKSSYSQRKFSFMLSATFIIFLFSLDLSAASAIAGHGAKAWGPGELATALVNTFHDHSSGCKGISIFKDAVAPEKQQEFYFVDMNTIEKLGVASNEKGIRKVPHKDWEDFVHATKSVPVPAQTVPPTEHYKRINVAKMQQYTKHYHGSCKLKLPLSAGLEKMLESKMIKRPYSAPATVFGRQSFVNDKVMQKILAEWRSSLENVELEQHADGTYQIAVPAVAAKNGVQHGSAAEVDAIFKAGQVPASTPTVGSEQKTAAAFSETSIQGGAISPVVGSKEPGSGRGTMNSPTSNSDTKDSFHSSGAGKETSDFSANSFVQRPLDVEHENGGQMGMPTVGQFGGIKTSNSLKKESAGGSSDSADGEPSADNTIAKPAPLSGPPIYAGNE